ncbi:MAG: tRNA pseudouridine(38-40) synthase TruA [Candidatus Eisenbacteria bacterium]|nr:tRNA pseudouridine(38-40) synthase TruA [Candidatus Eisenbacteria bacterium]
MPAYRMQVAYDGTEFHGWQTQPGLRTVQGEIERALAILTRERVRTFGAGRTDAGVHARGQVVSFRCDGVLEPRKAIGGIQALCGPEVRVTAFDHDAPPEFHARHDARWRRYRYRLLERSSPLYRTQAWQPKRLPSLPALRAASLPLRGRHDFSSFANASPDPSHPVCDVTRLDWERWEEGIELIVEADHFLYRMVRNIVGAVLAAARCHGGGADEVARILEARDRRVGGVPAPAHGLCLLAVGYDPPWPEGAP